MAAAWSPAVRHCEMSPAPALWSVRWDNIQDNVELWLSFIQFNAGKYTQGSKINHSNDIKHVIYKL